MRKRNNKNKNLSIYSVRGPSSNRRPSECKPDQLNILLIYKTYQML
jgi:hypothetical protein